MAERPTFDVSKMTAADKILLGGGFLFFIDTMLPWQKNCIDFPGGSLCRGSLGAWSGDGAWAGVLAGILVILLVAWLVATTMGVDIRLGVPPSSVGSLLVGGTVLFGVLKFLLVIASHASFGAWLGFVLLVVMAYGGYMKMQEPKTAAMPPPTSGEPPATPPPM